MFFFCMMLKIFMEPQPAAAASGGGACTNEAVNWSNERIANCILFALIYLWELYVRRGWCSLSGSPKHRRHRPKPWGRGG